MISIQSSLFLFPLRLFETTEEKVGNLSLAHAITQLVQGTRMHLGKVKIGGLCMKMISSANLKHLALTKYQQTGHFITLMISNLYLTFKFIHGF